MILYALDMNYLTKIFIKRAKEKIFFKYLYDIYLSLYLIIREVPLHHSFELVYLKWNHFSKNF